MKYFSLRVLDSALVILSYFEQTQHLITPEEIVFFLFQQEFYCQ